MTDIDRDVCEAVDCRDGYSHQGTSYARDVEEKQYAPCGTPCRRDAAPALESLDLVPLPEQLPEGTCLQCGHARDVIVAEKFDCHEPASYEGECGDEINGGFHRYKPWTDADLDRIKPEFRDAYRHAPMDHIEWAPCEHTVEGHRRGNPDSDDPENTCLCYKSWREVEKPIRVQTWVNGGPGPVKVVTL